MSEKVCDVSVSTRAMNNRVDDSLNCDFIEDNSVTPLGLVGEQCIAHLRPKRYDRYIKYDKSIFVQVMAETINGALSRGNTILYLDLSRVMHHGVISMQELLSLQVQLAKAIDQSHLHNADAQIVLDASEPVGALRTAPRLHDCAYDIACMTDADAIRITSVTTLHDIHQIMRSNNPRKLDYLSPFVRVRRDAGAPFMLDKMNQTLVDNAQELLAFTKHETQEQPIVMYDEKNTRSVKSQGARRFITWANSLHDTEMVTQ